MSFEDYELAMQRKMEIAQWHVAFLPDLVDSPADPHELPPIELQAHFEGAGRALASIPDQLASGISEMLGEAIPSLPKPHRAYLNIICRKLPESSELREVLSRMVVDPRYCDLRDWRNRATHRFDRKAMLDGLWVVAYPEDCPDPVHTRDLMSYMRIMVDYGWGIVVEVPTVKSLASLLIYSM